MASLTRYMMSEETNILKTLTFFSQKKKSLTSSKARGTYAESEE